MNIYTEEYLIQKVLNTDKEIFQQVLQNKEKYCIEVDVPKKNGVRKIVKIEDKSELKKIQKRLLKNFFETIPISPVAKGFIKGSSYIDFLEEHIGSEYFLRIDIKEFFDSISLELVGESLEQYIKNNTVRTSVMELCSINEQIPQGFVTSPAISNIVFRRIDQRILKYCREYLREGKREIIYTRYADDMLFSSKGFNFREHKNFKRMISHILKENGFSCNEQKTIYREKEISLSGYVIHEDVHLSRKKLKNINTVIYEFNLLKQYKKDDIKRLLKELNSKTLRGHNGQIIYFNSVESLAHYVAGYRSYLIEVLRAEHGETGYDKKIQNKIISLEKILDCLSE